MGPARVLCTGALLVLSGCAPEPAVELLGTCVADGEPVRLTSDAADDLPSVAIAADGRVWVTWARPLDAPWTELRGRWFDTSWAGASSEALLGSSAPLARARWVRTDSGVTAFAWVDPDGVTPPDEPEDAPRLWTSAPPTDVEAAPEITIADVSLPVSIDDAPSGNPLASLTTSVQFAGGGADVVPGVLGAGGVPIFTAAAIPSACSVVRGEWALLTFSVAASSFLGTDTTCSDPDLAPSNPWLIALADGSSGVLHRRGSAGAVHWVRFDDALRSIGAATQVGRASAGPSADTGWYLRGVALGAGRVVFGERNYGDYFTCSTLHRMAIDGSGSEAAPWQLPCQSDYHHWTRAYDLLPLDEGMAMIVFAERHSAGVVTSIVPWFEHIDVAMIGPEARRASEVVRVTPDSATALEAAPRTETAGPASADFSFAADTLGSEVVVVWRDRRADAPGIYGRRLRCQRD